MADFRPHNIPRAVLEAVTIAVSTTGRAEFGPEDKFPYAETIVMAMLRAWPDAWLGNDPDAVPTICLPIEGELTNG